MYQSSSPMTPKSSQGRGPYNNADRSTSGRDDPRQRKRESSLAPVIFVALAFLCFSIGLLAFAYYRNASAPITKAGSGLFTLSTPTTQSQASCQSLINQAISYTGQYCDHIGPNEACYGNTTIQAQMISNTSQRFSQRGDVVDMGQIQSISAAPLNLTTEEWGIAIFKVLGNVPGTVPGQAVTLMVFGNTNLNKPEAGLDTFFFSSDLGQIVCEKVPLDGLMITMPEGTGWTFKVNGTKMTLLGNASLTRNQNGNMVVSLFKGAAAITSLGQTQYFGAGQSVSVKMGGSSDKPLAVSPPSPPQPLSADEMAIACSTTGRYCTPDAIPTVSAADAQVMIQSGQALNPTIFGTPLPPAGSTGSTGGSSSGTSGSTGSQGSGGSGAPTAICSGLGNPNCNPNTTGQGGGGGGGGGNKP